MYQSPHNPRLSVLGHVILLMSVLVFGGGVYVISQNITSTLASGLILIALHLIFATGLLYVVWNPLKRRIRAPRMEDQAGIESLGDDHS